MFVLAVLALLVILGPALIKAITSVYGSHALLAALAIVLLSMADRLDPRRTSDANRRTLSIATALRNIGTCAVIATASFPDTLVGPTVLTYFLVQFIVTVIFRIYFGRTAPAAAPA